jgi:small subunit ribosomal protein S4
MSRYTGPKLRLARRLGQDLGHKQNIQKVAKRLSVLPGQHGRHGAKRLSEYGVQLREKQKARFAYGISEKQLRGYFAEALRNKSATGEELLRLLERRLDNVVYRLGLAPTRPFARQLVTHGHVRVSGKKIDIPSYRVKVEDVVSLSDKAVNIPDVKVKIADQSYAAPLWMQKTAGVGKIKSLPERIEIDMAVDEQLIVEYYSR